MREYNLFVIKNEYLNVYQNNPFQLFEILKKLFNMNKNLNYGITFYEQLCNYITPDTLRYYLNTKYNLDNYNKFYIDKTFIELKPSRIVIKSRYNIPNIIKVFNCYNRNIFVCDFINGDYFWLNNFARSKVLEYI